MREHKQQPDARPVDVRGASVCFALKRGGELKDTAMAWLAVYPDGSAHQLDELLTDCQSQSHAIVFSRGRSIGLHDWGLLSGVGGFDNTAKSATGGKGAGDFGPNRPAGLHDILQDAVDGVFVEDAEISVGVEIHFE